MRSVTIAALTAWQQAGGPGPNAAEPSFDWEEPMSKRWNKEMIVVLCDAFMHEVDAAKHAPLTRAQCPSGPLAIINNLGKKLQVVQTAYNKHKQLTADEYDEQKIDGEVARRRTTRRNGVSAVISFVSPADDS